MRDLLHKYLKEQTQTIYQEVFYRSSINIHSTLFFMISAI